LRAWLRVASIEGAAEQADAADEVRNGQRPVRPSQLIRSVIPALDAMQQPGQRIEGDAIRRLLDHPTATEALAWLRREDGVVRTLGESESPAEAIAFIGKLYDAGAVAVTATEIHHYEREDLEGVTRLENTGRLVVTLPGDATSRKRIFRMERKVSRGLGFDPRRDEGQTHLFFMLD
jgi:hypothetical protein